MSTTQESILNVSDLRFTDPVWHAFIIALSHDEERFDAYRKAAEADPRDEIEVTITARGVSFPFKPVFDLFNQCFDAEVRKAAERLWNERMGATMAEMEARVREVFGLPAGGKADHA